MQEQTCLQFCIEEGHEDSEMSYLCLKKECKYKTRFFCQLCAISSPHLFEDKDFVISVKQLQNKNQIFVDNWPPIAELKDLSKQSKLLKQGSQQGFINIIKQQYDKLKADFIKEIDRQQKNIIVAISSQQQESNQLFSQISEKISRSSQLMDLRTIVQKYLENRSDLDTTLSSVQSYIDNLENQTDIQDILNIYISKKAEFKRNTDQQQRIINMVEGISVVKQIEEVSKRIINFLTCTGYDIQFSLIKDLKHDELASFIKDLSVPLYTSESNIQFTKSPYSGSSTIVQTENEYVFNEQTNSSFCCQYIISEKFERKDKMFFKIKIEDYKLQETHKATNYFILGIKNQNIANQSTCQHTKNSGIMLSGAKASYDKGALTYLGNDLSDMILKGNQIFYVYVDIQSQNFIFFSENKEIICFKIPKSNDDFEAGHNEWCFVIGSAYHSMKLTILNAVKLQI